MKQSDAILEELRTIVAEMDRLHARRDLLIARAIKKHGLSLRTVAPAAGLTHGAIALIRDKEGDRK